MVIIKGIIALLLLVGGIFLLAVFVLSIIEFYSAHKNSDVRMSFEQFSRIYNLSPNKWFYYNDCTMGRKEYVKENGNGLVSKEVFVSMKTYFDFLCLVVWQWKIDRKEQKEENFKDEMKELETQLAALGLKKSEIKKIKDEAKDEVTE